jgi:hypothetical protein
MRTLAMSGWRGSNRTLLSTGTTTEGQVIRQLQPAIWQQVPRLHLPIEIEQGQGQGHSENNRSNSAPRQSLSLR